MSVLLLCLFSSPTAKADSSTEASTIWGDGPSVTTSPAPGNHDDYTIIQKFNYGNGTEPQGGTDDIKKWIVDSPAGLAGNPNSIPYEDRCDPSAFDPSGTLSPYESLYGASSCPASSIVGSARVYLATDTAGTFVPAGTPITPMNGVIYILKTSPEVPTTLATRFTSGIYQPVPVVCPTGSAVTPCPIYPKTKSVLQPVTKDTASGRGDGDYRIRTVPADDSAPPVAYLPTGAPPTAPFDPGPTNLHIYRIDQHLFGKTAGNENFLTYPTRSNAWNSYSYLQTHDANPAATETNLDPNNSSAPYVASSADAITPDQSVKPVLVASLDATFTTGKRGSNTGLVATVSNPTVPGGDMPKKIVTTLPASATIDLDAIASDKICSIADRNASNCSAATKVGTATIQTPFITAGLTGDVHLVKSDTSNLPDLSIFVTGAISFRIDASNKFAGKNNNQVQTTLDNLPQTPFTKFTLNINGGDNSLLINRSCSSSTNSELDNGPVVSSITGYTDAVVNNSSPAEFTGCYGAPVVKSIHRCIDKRFILKARGLTDTTNIDHISLYAGKKNYKRLVVDKKSPFTASKNLNSSQFKKGLKYKFKYRVFYKATPDFPDGKVARSQTAYFSRCK